MSGIIFKYQFEENSPEIEFRLHPDTTLDDLLTHFEQFIKAVGYYPPHNAVLDFVPEEE